jgi:poly-gamma-glutamate capsule biosynthesis protein CapA/YwtB (metallophosphatase superfamily)
MRHFRWTLLLSFMLICGCFEMTSQQESTIPTNKEPPPLATPRPVTPPPPLHATLVAVGDIMMHTPQLPGAYNTETKSYDFDGFFRPVHSILSSADWTFANLETPIAGDSRGFRGYPLFNAPVALARTLADTGFDVVSTANNHALDQGISGLIHTLGTLVAHQLVPVGTAATQENSDSIVILERNQIKQAFLAYTYGTNGIPIPEDKTYAVNLIEKQRIARDVAKARESGADLVTVSLHYGSEYQRTPNQFQKQISRYCIDVGADIVLGHHPHVVQPYERYIATQDDGSKREGLIVYSLGNFISNQFGGYKEFGVIFKIDIKKIFTQDGASDTFISAVEVIPTWVNKYVSNGKKQYRVLSLNNFTQLKEDPLLTVKTVAMLTDKAEEMQEHLQKLNYVAEEKK